MFGTNDTWTLEAETLPELFELIKAEDTKYEGCPEGYFYTTINHLDIVRPKSLSEPWRAVITAVIF